ncbi:fungal-specific transcription factor domain-containing protein [Bombardia bombarda]|uniref:Fungal-specific transcription factor domain-containing protein n=1 Tax=Bombardia bombarda TaxID=252184 RepID=A0AA39T157_9PEZI|nr:fungal-specific transcription factor domain-containing protein [Bombardia bombarda]
MENHPRDLGPQKTRLVACVMCHERKLKCDHKTPCRSCTRAGVECVRSGQFPSPAATSRNTDEETEDVDEIVCALDGDEWAHVQQTSHISLPGVTTPASHNVEPWESAKRPNAFNQPPLDSQSGAIPPDPFGRETDTSQHDIDSFSSNPPPAPTSQTSHVAEDVPESGRQYLLAMPELVVVYFERIHPYWPILHAPTFDLGTTSDLLVASMAILSGWALGRDAHKELAPHVFREVMAATELKSLPSLHTLQALLLCVVYTIYCRTDDDMLATAVRFSAILTSTCRCLDIFNGGHVLPDRLEDNALTFWLAKEQLHRLVFSVLRVDVYLSILLDHPPSVRYQELCLPLLKSPELWAAETEDERRELQWSEPAGRERALFSFLMRDSITLADASRLEGRPQERHLLPYRMNMTDYHICLCGIQAGIWEAAREAHSAASDDIVTKLTPGDPIMVWRTHLAAWRACMGRNCGDVVRRFFAAERCPDPLTLVLSHISALKMHAPLNILRLHHGGMLSGRTGPSAAAAAAMAAIQRPKARLRAWMASPCARTAVWDAAQIARVVLKSVGDGSVGDGSVECDQRLQMNPLAVPGLLMSAIVTCSYMYMLQDGGCPECALPGHFSEEMGFDLFDVGEDDVRLNGWRDYADGWAAWGVGRIPVCKCQLGILGRWFSGALARDQGAQREFEAFFEGLKE